MITRRKKSQQQKLASRREAQTEGRQHIFIISYNKNISHKILY